MGKDNESLDVLQSATRRRLAKLAQMPVDTGALEKRLVAILDELRRSEQRNRWRCVAKDERGPPSGN
jgi:hypothetical protein